MRGEEIEKEVEGEKERRREGEKGFKLCKLTKNKMTAKGFLEYVHNY